jgi:hypothetical protein
MIAGLDHIHNIPIDCEGMEYVPAILLSVNKMVAICWWHMTTIDVTCGCYAISISYIVAVVYADHQTQVGGLQF